jgi:hypothetical protein
MFIAFPADNTAYEKARRVRPIVKRLADLTHHGTHCCTAAAAAVVCSSSVQLRCSHTAAASSMSLPAWQVPSGGGGSRVSSALRVPDVVLTPALQCYTY